MCFQVGAANSFSEWAITMVASISKHNSWDRSGAAPAAHAAARAAPRPARSRGRWPADTRSRTRHAVGVDATGPYKSGWSRSAARSLIESAPSAIATAKSASTAPGKWIGIAL